MKKTIRLIKCGENKQIYSNDLPSVFELLKTGTEKGMIEEFQHTANIRAYRRKDALIGSTILSYDLQKKELIFFDPYQFQVFCKEVGVKITNFI